MAVSTLLVVVFFAYLVEWAAVVRSRTANTPVGFKVAMGVSLFGVGSGFVLSQLPLVGVLNSGGLSGDAASKVWVSSGIEFVLLFAGLVLAALAPRD